MNKALIILFVMLASLPHTLYGQEPANYEIIINGKKYDISLGRAYQKELVSGDIVSFRVDKKAVMTYKDDFVSFEHNGSLTISSTDLGDGIRQAVISTALGTLILIQEYSFINPTSMANITLQALTKDQIKFGYKMQKKTYSKELKNGTKLNGNKVTLSLNDEEEHWTVLSYGKKDKGLLVITKIDKQYIEREKDIIELMWETLQIVL